MTHPAETAVREHLELHDLMRHIAVLTTVGECGIGVRLRPDTDQATTSEVLSAVNATIAAYRSPPVRRRGRTRA